MKKTYIISLISFLLLGGCIYYASYYYTRHYTKEIPLQDTAQLKETSKTQSQTTNQTEYVLETYNAKNYEMTEEKMSMPAQYVGKTRSELIELLKEYEENPDSADKEKGLSSFSLICFSDSKVVLRKTYHEDIYDNEYEARVDSLGKITIYRTGTNEIYTDTGIEYKKLPEDIRHKIDQGEKFHGLKEIFDFLENYSS